MSDRLSNRESWNAARYRADNRAGHYESWFQRANHPDRPLAFWNRYTIFSPKGRPQDGIGELWAIWFDGEAHQVIAAKTELPIADCQFSGTGLKAQIGEAVLNPQGLRGAAGERGQRIAWDLSYTGNETPLLTLPEEYYARGLPKAKGLVGTPLARYSGMLEVNGQRYVIDNWSGSQNHNWGSKHTDQYAWGQVAGFEEHPDSFLECITARVKLGPLWSPWMSIAVLRHDGREYCFNRLGRAFRAKGGYDGWDSDRFNWHFVTSAEAGVLEVKLSAPHSDFVGLTYYNPPGGSKTCLNSKIAACKLRFTPADGSPLQLNTAHRAAFEILTERQDHGITVAA